MASTDKDAGMLFGPVLEHRPLTIVVGNSCNVWLKMQDARIMVAVVLPTIYISQYKP